MNSLKRRRLYRQTLHHIVDPRQNLDHCNTSCMLRGGRHAINCFWRENGAVFFSPEKIFDGGGDGLVWADFVGYPLLDIALRYTGKVYTFFRSRSTGSLRYRRCGSSLAWAQTSETGTLSCSTYSICSCLHERLNPGTNST